MDSLPEHAAVVDLGERLVLWNEDVHHRASRFAEAGEADVGSAARAKTSVEVEFKAPSVRKRDHAEAAEVPQGNNVQRERPAPVHVRRDVRDEIRFTLD